MAGAYPRRFGKFVLLKPIARGGMGEIYLAATGDPGFQKFCVIKRMIAQKTDPAKANRFLDEAKVVLRLSHANLVSTFDAGEVDGEFFIAMELIEGKDLREIWNRCVRTRTRIPLDVALHVGREIARALSYVHSYGDLRLVHRDVAPPNILLSYFGEVKLTDFGLARSVLKQEHTAPGVVFGRASYLAPEQARGEVADGRTDIYSLGIVLWELLTGNQYLQIGNLDPTTAMSLVRHPRIERPSAKAPWISKDLDDLLMRALAPEREDRFQTAEELRQALSDVMAKLAPRADVERTAGFVRGLYDNAIRDERAERDRLLARAQPLFQPAAAAHAVVAAPAPVAAAPPSTHPSPFPPATDQPPDARAPVTEPARAKGPIEFPKEEESAGVDFNGRVIDNRYRVIEKIGEGGMGTVYLGEHAEIGKEVALKILHPAYSNEQDLVERFRREARAASRIGHPNIIDVTDYGSTEEGCAYFVMEYLDGIDLADVLSHERRLEPTRACQIAIQICRALAAAHAAGVVHRDLKPENIFLVSRDGKADFVKVLDFGIARSPGRSRLTNPGVAMGTPEYMAPEQAAGGVVDQRSDIYSVGALLYEMVTGTPPQIRNRELVSPRVLRNELPDEIDRTIGRALEPDPERRYQTMSQLEYEIVKALWGRARAVNELLGLRVMRRRGEMTPQKDTPLSAIALDALPRAIPTPAGGLAALDRAVGRGPGSAEAPAPASQETRKLAAPLLEQTPPPRGPRTVANLRMETPPRGRFGPGRRFAATFAVLAIASALAVLAYRRGPFPWNAPATAAPAPAAAVLPAVPSEAELRARRQREAVAEVERNLAGELDAARVSALKASLARLRADGGGAVADGLLARAKTAVVKGAEAAFDSGDLEAGVARYRLAEDLGDDRASEALARSLQSRGEAARDAGKPDEALRWARALVGVADGDADAHGRLADALAANDQDDEAAAEYKRALTGLPGDRGLSHGLARVEKRLAVGRRHRRRARGEGRAASARQTAAATADDSAAPAEGERTAKSAPAEPAAEQQ